MDLSGKQSNSLVGAQIRTSPPAQGNEHQQNIKYFAINPLILNSLLLNTNIRALLIVGFTLIL
jgi:hypothetical protein